jgi:hypothetical protein
MAASCATLRAMLHEMQPNHLANMTWVVCKSPVRAEGPFRLCAAACRAAPQASGQARVAVTVCRGVLAGFPGCARHEAPAGTLGLTALSVGGVQKSSPSMCVARPSVCWPQSAQRSRLIESDPQYALLDAMAFRMSRLSRVPEFKVRGTI